MIAMFKPIVGFTMLTIAAATAIAARAQDRLLSDEEWAADIRETAETIKREHPAPFRHVEEGDFDAAVRDLIAGLPDLSDKEVIVGMARIVALVHDGHTRLSFPRRHPELGFSFSHSAPRDPKFDKLKFAVLPLQFRVFGDALHIVRAEAADRRLVGAEVLKFGATDAAEAMERVSAVNYIDNEMTDMILTADRLTLPEVMAALDIIDDPDFVRLTLRRRGADAEEVVTIAPAGAGEVTLLGPEGVEAPPALRDRLRPKWAMPFPDRRAHFIKLNEIEAWPEDIFLSDFMAREVSRAEAAGADRLIIDIRHNHGGSGGHNRGIVNAIQLSPYNRPGKFLILTGRESFSAAQMLLNELEKYTDALFFGEPSGSTPDHFGDPMRIQLENSGLTLRVSRLYWSGGRAFDDRSATEPHVSVDYTIDDYMAGRDPVLEAALSYEAPESLAELAGAIFADGGNWAGGTGYLLRWLTDPRVGSRDLPALGAELIRVAEGYEAANEAVPALLLYVVAQRVRPGDARAYLGWGRNAEALGDMNDARAAYETGLAALPENEELAQRLEALPEPEDD